MVGSNTEKNQKSGNIINLEVAEITKDNKCSNCGRNLTKAIETAKDIGMDIPYCCPKCGFVLSATEKPKYCEICSTPLPEYNPKETKFCIGCGRKLKYPDTKKITNH